MITSTYLHPPVERSVLLTLLCEQMRSAYSNAILVCLSNRPGAAVLAILSRFICQIVFSSRSDIFHAFPDLIAPEPRSDLEIQSPLERTHHPNGIALGIPNWNRIRIVRATQQARPIYHWQCNWVRRPRQILRLGQR